METSAIERFTGNLVSLGLALKKVQKAFAKFAESLSEKFGFKAYQRAGYPYRKTVRGYKKWQKQQFGYR